MKDKKSIKKSVQINKKDFPTLFPFWARLKVDKKRTTLVIDGEKIKNEKSNKIQDYYVHREATHSFRKDYEKIVPNPDKADTNPMFLKRPSKRPKKNFEVHNKQLKMPEDLKDRYKKNNKK